MPGPERDRRSGAVAGLVFAVLVIAGNALQGSTPALHGDADAVTAYYLHKPTRLAIAMSLSLVSLFFLAWFLTALSHALDRLVDPSPATRTVSLGAAAALALLAGGFALNAAGALRAAETGAIAPEAAVVFYDGSLVLTGLAAPLAMAVLLAGTAVVVRRGVGLPAWLGHLSTVLAVLGIVTPLSFVLFLAFPFWVAAASVVLLRAQDATPATSGCTTG